MPRITDLDGHIASAVQKWKGDPMYMPGQVNAAGRLICGARKRNDDPCGGAPPKGATRCGKHGGASPQAKRAADARNAEQELENTVTTLGIREKYPDVDPGAALLEEIRITHAHVQWLRSKVAELDSDELSWGRTQHEFGAGPEGPIDKETFKSTPSIWYELYVRERDHLVKVSAAALKAGIEERRVRLAESQGELVATVLRRILNGLNLTPQQWETAQVVVPTELRAIEGTPA